MRFLLIVGLVLVAFVQAIAQPTAGIQTTDTLGCVPYTAQFSSASTNAVAWQWDLGNGAVSSSENPSTIYTSPGLYTVKLVVTDANGAVDSVTYNNLVDVVPTPVADYSFTVLSNCEEQNSIVFINNSQYASSYLWDFGDGNYSTDPSPTHSFANAGTFQVTLVASNALGCNDAFTASSTITILPSPSAGFGVDTTLSCDVNHVFTFTPNATNNQSYQWSFGDGSTSTAVNPTHTYAASGTYTVSLIVGSAAGCVDSVIMPSLITVASPPVPTFSVDADTGCAPMTVNFTNSTAGVVQAIWDFGNGTTGSGATASEQYSVAGTYDIQLDVTDTLGCSASLVSNNHITVYAVPTAAFTTNDTAGCAPHAVTFTNNSINAVTYLWDFGDGATSALANPTHVYSNPGNYTVTLQVAGTDGCTDEEQYNVIEVLSTYPQFTSTNQTGCAPLSIQFTDGSSNAVQWTWLFGDGASSTAQHPTHTYTTNGLYNVTLITENSLGCVDTIVYPDYVNVYDPGMSYSAASPIVGCIPFNVNFNGDLVGNTSWLWDFGDGTTSTDTNTNHYYATPGTYVVSLTTYTLNGCQTTIDTFAIVEANGSQGLLWMGPIDCNTMTVDFADSAGLATSWLWEFGDGDTSTLQNPSHMYGGPGIYTVQLTTTAMGCVTTNSISTFVDFSWCTTGNGFPPIGGGNGGAAALPDTVSPTLPITGCIPFINQFMNPFTGFTQVQWHFGDGTTSSQNNPVHVYTTPGSFDVMLILTDSFGVTDTIFFPDYVQLNGVIPQMLYSESFSCDSMTVNFDENSQAIVSWDWLFSNGVTETIPDPTQVIERDSVAFTALLTIEDTFGCVVTTATTIFPLLITPNFQYEDTVCLGDNIQFTSGLPAYYTLLWDFGDGITSNQATPVHAYDTTNFYQVTLQATDTTGCTEVYNLDPMVYAHGPSADFSIVGPSQGCIDLQVQFQAQFPNADSYSWEVAPGVPKSGVAPTHLYTSAGSYDVTLEVEKDGCFASSIQLQAVEAHEATANFSLTQSGTCFPMTVSFTDLSTAATSWLWDFGDGSTSTAQNPQHNYINEPAGAITLTIVDSNGCQDVKTVPALDILVADFTVSNNAGCAPFSTDFADQSSNAISWLWHFGDGATSTLQNPTHTYLSAGVYDVTLIVTSASGCIDTFVAPGFINADAPIAAFTSTQTGSNCAPMVVNFQDSSAAATSWYWDFGDGATATVQHPVHVYDTPGLYTVSLVITNALGCADTIIKVDYILVDGPIADFTMSDTIGCPGLTVQFNSMSSSATTWQWDLGGGILSNDSTPTFTYDNTGSYNITLVVSDSNGCIDFHTVTNAIVVEAPPTAAFTISDTIGCPGLSIDFVDSMTNSATWIWDLGDTIVNNIAPVNYTYSQPGTFNVMLIAADQYGCIDTSAVQTIVIEDAFDATLTAVSPLCLTDTVIALQFADSGGVWSGVGVLDPSDNLFDPSTAGIGIHDVTYALNGFCGDADTIQIEVQAPVDASITPVAAACANVAPFQLTAVDSGGIWYGAGITDSIAGTFDPSVAGAGTHTISYAIHGACSDSATIELKVHPLPIADIRVDALSGCAPLTVTLSDQSSVQGAGSYTWYVNGVQTSSQQSVTVTLGPGMHDVAYVVQNQFGCTDSVSFVDYIHVSDTIAPPATLIERVSVVSNTDVVVQWEPSTAADFDHYSIYRETTQGSYTLVATISDVTTTSYTETGLNTLSNVYCYKVQVSDSCGYQLPLDDLTAHCTMNVETDLVGTDVLVQWTPYVGCSFSRYEIYRLKPSAAMPEYIGSTVPGTHEFLDTSAYCPLSYSYRIKAIELHGGQLYSMSDTATQSAPGTLHAQKPRIVRTTVVDDEAVLTEWLPPATGASEVVGYRLYKAEMDTNFFFVGFFDSTTLSYTDYNVDVMLDSYTYRIEAVNTCEVTGINSNIGTSILLEKTKLNDFQTKLNWTPYEEWNSGVEYYEIQRQREDGTWEVVKVVGGSEIETVIEH